MSTRFLLLCFTTLSTSLHLSAAEPSFDLRAHEWGTFTAVTGSDGVPVPWWTPALEGPAALPEFVRPLPALSKIQQPWLLRMETPVIYFYANQPARVQVRVGLNQLRLTDVFPQAQSMPLSMGMLDSAPFEAIWELRLQPPGDSVGKHLPQVAERGAHYGHARAVPQAWWVVNGTPPEAPEVEKFLFYRGAGNAQMPRRIAGVASDGVTLFPGGTGLFLVQVDAQACCWREVGRDASIAARGNSYTVPLPAQSDSPGSADALAQRLRDALSAAGLTADEAAAMVATWREAWLAEPGLRVLEILPREWVDQVLPLRIEPAPEHLERVFVARWELLTAEDEEAALTLLEQPPSAETPASPPAGWRRGRFTPALLERVAAIRDQRFRQQIAQTASLWRQSGLEENENATTHAHDPGH